MNAVGIDVSKGKSMASVLRPLGEVVAKQFPVRHTGSELKELADYLKSLDGETRVITEHTGRYYEPVAQFLHDSGLSISAVNLKLIKDYRNNSPRKVKTDKADSRKIAKYGLDNWVELRQYVSMDTIRYQPKTLNRQYNLYIKTMIKNNLISLTDKVFPGVNELFISPDRNDSRQKWVDFVTTFWHCECISRASEAAFTERYRKWCKRKGYHFSERKAAELYMDSMGHITTLPRNSSTKLLITTAAKELASAKATLAALRTEMTRLAQQLPEYETVRAIYAVGETTAVQLMEEIGDVRRFPRRSSIVSFAGVDPTVTSPASTSPRAIPRRNGALLTCARRCTRLSAPTSANLCL